MAAKNMDVWRGDRREGKVRYVRAPRHLLVCEDKEVESRVLKWAVPALGAADGCRPAIVCGGGERASRLVDFAVEYCRYSPETFDHVWLIFDEDAFPPAERGGVEHRCADLSDGCRTFHALWCGPMTKAEELVDEMGPYLSGK